MKIVDSIWFIEMDEFRLMGIVLVGGGLIGERSRHIAKCGAELLFNMVAQILNFLGGKK